MNLITTSWKMADVIHSNYLLMPIITRFGIPPGYGEESVGALCRKHGVDTEFFLLIINAYSHEAYFPEKRLQGVNGLLIVDYLEKTHSYYRTRLVPAIEALLKKLGSSDRQSRRTVRLVKRFFNQYKRELLAHLRREETVTFPYVRQVIEQYRCGPKDVPKQGHFARYSMKVYEAEHDNVDEKLFDLKNILLKYVHGTVDESVLEAMMFELFRLEKDLREHTRIEDTILQPLIAEMEKGLAIPAQRQPSKTAKRPDARQPELALLRQLGQALGTHALNPGQKHSDGLTVRERQVLVLVAHGLLNKEIADRLSISPHTVISHRKNLTRKLQIKTVPGLTMYAILNGLIASNHAQR